MKSTIFLLIIILLLVVFIRSQYLILNLYFANNTEDKFIIKKEIILKKNLKEIDIIKLVIEKLTTDTDNIKYFSTIPPNSKIKNITIKDGITILDFNENFYLNHPGGSRGEILTIYSIINSICYTLNNIKKVQILIEGKKKQTYRGHIDISKPLSPKKYILKEI